MDAAVMMQSVKVVCGDRQTSGRSMLRGLRYVLRLAVELVVLLLYLNLLLHAEDSWFPRHITSFKSMESLLPALERTKSLV